jgi:hypothetical protein
MSSRTLAMAIPDPMNPRRIAREMAVTMIPV